MGLANCNTYGANGQINLHHQMYNNSKNDDKYWNRLSAYSEMSRHWSILSAKDNISTAAFIVMHLLEQNNLWYIYIIVRDHK